jgi:hypothetical protein
MNEINSNRRSTGEDGEFVASDGSSSIYRRPPAVSFVERLSELEIENARLHRLVAELLIKNQQLRTSH